jgi:hypothetical protein
LEPVDGRFRMTRVTLRPHIMIAPDADLQRAHDLVAKAHAGCFISNSVSTVVDVEPVIERTYDHVDSDQIEGYGSPPVVGADVRGR